MPSRGHQRAMNKDYERDEQFQSLCKILLAYLEVWLTVWSIVKKGAQLLFLQVRNVSLKFFRHVHT